jgi:flagellar assembly factor FliW
MKYPTTRFGDVEVADDQIIRFPEGVIGFESCTSFCLVDKTPEATVWWLQSLDQPHVAFILTSPYFCEQDYQIKLTSVDMEVLDINTTSQVEVAAILVVQRDEERKITANLLAPVLVNYEKRLGKQIILRDSGYSAKQPVQQIGAVSSERRGG